MDDMTLDKPVAVLLREARENAGMTVSEVFEYTGIDAMTMERYERDGMGGSTPVAHILALCAAYGMTSKQAGTILDAIARSM